MNSALMFSKASDEWRTPEATFNELNAEFGFDLDVAATADNYWTSYLGPGHVDPDRRDALAVRWSRMTSRPTPAVCFMNPPYSRCSEFIEKAACEARHGATVVALVPSRTDTRWWHQHIWDAERHQPRRGVEVRFIKGRLKFGDGKNSAPFPSVVVIFRPPTFTETPG